MYFYVVISSKSFERLEGPYKKRRDEYVVVINRKKAIEKYLKLIGSTKYAEEIKR